MHETATLDLGRIAQDLQIRKVQVESVIQLLDEGNTVPFITRYRKERTGGLDEDLIRTIGYRIKQQRQLHERKQTILKSVQAQGKLTEEVQKAIMSADTSRRLEDLYLPFKPKKKSMAAAAREKGLGGLAEAVWANDPSVANFSELLPTFVNPEKQLNTPEDVRLGVQHILAEQIAETPEVREAARRVLWETGKLVVVRSDKLGEGQGLEYKDYFQFSEPARHIPPHRILAINRGEKENALRARLEWNKEALESAVLGKLPLAEHPHAEFLKACAADALERLLQPSLEREIRRELTDEAEEHALQVFSRNLRRLLLQPPIRGQRVLAVDPGFRSGCKLAVLDEIGTLVEHEVIHPHPIAPRREDKKRTKEETPAANSGSAPGPDMIAPPAVGTSPLAPATAENVAPAPVDLSSSTPAAPLTAAESPPVAPQSDRREEAKAKLTDLVRRHGVHLVAIGNGTACRETEELIAELIAGPLTDLAYVIVNEAGASHYSASNVGREEFPDLDATARGTVSIGRRLQDPLSELVKIDPQNIGVGLYQHDISEKRLKESLEAVIESCVNYVGVDLNTASVPLLRHVAGLNQLTARTIVEHRKANGPFRDRAQLKQVPGVGEGTFTQAAGFLKIPGGDNPLDATWVHPESYPATARLLELVGHLPQTLFDGAGLPELREKLAALTPEQVAQQLEVGLPTFRDIIEALSKPGRDPREDLPKPIFKRGILRLEDLQSGMELKGTVLNVVDFGAFVDVGLKDSGLVHISQLANRFVKSPHDIVSVGDVVTVWVLQVDHERRRVSLTMIKPGTERRPPEKRPERLPRRQEQGQGQGQGQRRGHGRRQDQRGRRPVPAQQAGQGQTQGAATTDQSPPPRRPVPQRPHRPPRRERPAPKLSEAELAGQEPLHTFAELKAFFEAKKQQ